MGMTDPTERDQAVAGSGRRRVRTVRRRQAPLSRSGRGWGPWARDPPSARPGARLRRTPSSKGTNSRTAGPECLGIKVLWEVAGPCRSSVTSILLLNYGQGIKSATLVPMIDKTTVLTAASTGFTQEYA